MHNKKMFLIINPISGVHSKEGYAEKFAHKLNAYGYDVDFAYTRHRGHAFDLATQAVADGYGSVAVCGGDGTVNETANALCGTGVNMGIIPSGSGNGLARHMGIPIDEIKSLDIIGEGCVLDCDCGLIGDQRFFCTYGVGFDASVSHRFAHEQRRGRITYIKDVIQEFLQYKPHKYVLRIGSEVIEREAFLVAVCNASQYGNNAFIAPEASVTDGLLDIVVIKSGSALRMLLAGFDVMTGMVPYNSHIDTFRVSSAVIEHQGKAYAHIDGEPVSFDGRVEVKCLPKQLRIFSNPIQKPFVPFIRPIDLTLRDWGIAIEKIFRPD